MDAKQLWQMFCANMHLDESTPYEAWAFGFAPDELASLTLAGTKTATASVYELYEIEQEPFPKVGDYSVILNARDDAVCVIRDTKVTVVPFLEVGEEHAYREGEGDRTLADWRKTHEACFTEELAELGLPFNQNIHVVCEEFEVVFRP